MMGRGEMQDFTCLTFINDSSPLHHLNEVTQALEPVIKSKSAVCPTDHTMGRIVAGTANGDLVRVRLFNNTIVQIDLSIFKRSMYFGNPEKK